VDEVSASPFIERTDFVTIPTRDVGRAKAFYNGILELPSKSECPDEFETGNLTLSVIADFERAARLNPTYGPLVEKDLKRARRIVRRK